MSLHGSGRFARRRDSEVNSSGGSIHSNFSVQRQQPTYEPGTGGHFMAQSGWHNRDAYGKAKTTTTTIHPNVGAGGSFGGALGANRTSAPHSVKFTQSPDYKTIYLIALIVVSILLLALILLFIILFLTGVFVFNSVPAVPLPSTSSPSLSSHPPPSLSGFVVPPSTSIVLPAPSNGPSLSSSTTPEKLQTRTFECELYIEDQANNAYNDTDTFEYNQAMQIVQSAITSTLDGSTLRDLTPIVTVHKIENGENDLRVLFRISIVVIPQSSIRADSIENVLKTESMYLESLLNNTTLDRDRISARLVSSNQPSR